MTLSPSGVCPLRRKGIFRERTQTDVGNAMARANGLPTPKRKPPADTPERKLDAIARAVVNGGMDAAEAARRVNSVVSRSDAKAAIWMRHRVRKAIENAPPAGTFAAAVNAVSLAERNTSLLAFAPQWVQDSRRRDGGRGRALLYSRLYFLAFALGAGGRAFEFAQCAVAVAFGVNGGDVREFIRKATVNGSMETAWRGRILSTYFDANGNERHRRGANGYRFIPRGCEGEAGMMIYGCLRATCPALVYGCPERETLASNVAGI